MAAATHCTGIVRSRVMPIDQRGLDAGPESGDVSRAVIQSLPQGAVQNEEAVNSEENSSPMAELQKLGVRDNIF